MEATKPSTNISLRHVRLSFPAIWQPESVNGSEPRFAATFLLDKQQHASTIAEIRNTIIAAAEAKWGKGKVKWAGVKVCLRDGKEKPDLDGFGDGVNFISASSKVRVPVVDADPSIPLAESDNRPYAGCYVNAIISLWVQDNQFGKRVNAQLKGIQFVKDGEPFGEKAINPTEVFKNEAVPSSMPASRPPTTIDPADFPPSEPPQPSDDIPF